MNRLLPVLAALATTSAVAAPLPALWSAPVAKLDVALVKPPYAVVARPFFGQRFNGVDIVTLDPATMRPIARSPTSLNCLRVHVAADGSLLCYTNVVPGRIGQFSNPTSYLFAPDLAPLARHASEVNGQPNRARMSADGKLSATTEFVTGHSYAGTGGNSFSTETSILHNDAPAKAENLQEWPVLQEGRKVTSADLNLWGVTFQPSNSDHFFVTAYFAGKPHLAEGSVSARSINVVRDGVECPSFSPDGKRLAFKKRTSSTGWSPAVLDLATSVETVYDVGVSVDDQIEWSNEHTLVYEVVTRPLIGSATSDLMSLDLAEPHPTQHVWLEQARSPGFVRSR